MDAPYVVADGKWQMANGNARDLNLCVCVSLSLSLLETLPFHTFPSTYIYTQGYIPLRNPFLLKSISQIQKNPSGNRTNERNSQTFCAFIFYLFFPLLTLSFHSLDGMTCFELISKPTLYSLVLSDLHLYLTKP